MKPIKRPQLKQYSEKLNVFCFRTERKYQERQRGDHDSKETPTKHTQLGGQAKQVRKIREKTRRGYDVTTLNFGRPRERI